MIQQTIQIGNSIGVIIPKKVLDEKKIRIGDTVQVDIEPIKKQKKSTLTPDFLKWVDQYIKKNRPALEELARR